MRYIDYLRENRLETAAYELALWMKIVYPLAIGVMIVLAVLLVLGRLGGAGIGQRILAGCLIAVTFHVVNEVSGKMGIVYGLNPSLSAFAPTLLFLAAGCGCCAGCGESRRRPGPEPLADNARARRLPLARLGSTTAISGCV